MLDKDYVLAWEDIDHDLYEQNGYIFGVELDLFNNHKLHYCKIPGVGRGGRHVYAYLSDDIYDAIEEFNAILQKTNNT